MASVVDICNLALAHLGDSATVSSIDPPEGSAQADHCARFYPIARDTLLESHQWGFTVRRAALARLADVAGPEWDYAYAVPTGMLNVISVLPADATDDYVEAPLVFWSQAPVMSGARYNTQPFTIETMADGSQAILTDQVDAWARYTVSITDSSKFSPLFVGCLSWLLARYLAGPVLKGDAGVAAGRTCFNTYLQRVRDATESDSNQRQTKPAHVVSWMAAR